MYKTVSIVIGHILWSAISAIAFAGDAYKDNGNGTVTDFATGLIWQKADDGITRSFTLSRAYCGRLSLGGLDEWRLPEIKELSSLLDYRNTEVAINRRVFPGTVSQPYFTVSLRGSPFSIVTINWVVDFGSGEVVERVPPSAGYHTRCVHD